MASEVFQYAPNRVYLDLSASSTTWNVVATDGTLYASIAALRTAGKSPWPNLDPGGFLQFLSYRSTTSTGIADGGPFGVAINQAAAPTDTTGSRLVSGSGQTINDPGPVYCIWIRKTTATDIVQLTGGY